MFYDFRFLTDDQPVTNTIVIYDIAGEDCETAAKMTKYGNFINYSDGIILLVDPGQLKWAGADRVIPTEPQAVLNTIYNATLERGAELSTKPVAVCVSKSDSFEDMIPGGKSDIFCVRDKVMGTKIPVFNATDYNQLEQQLQEAMNEELALALKNQYKYFNYFAFSAIGGPVKEETATNAAGEPIRTEDGREKKVSYPIDPPIPRRIAEPLFWLFYRFGYIHSDVPIRLPAPRKMPSQIEVAPTGLFKNFKKPTYRPLTDAEKRSYWYEPTN